MVVIERSKGPDLPCALVVGDVARGRGRLGIRLAEAGFRVESAADRRDALARVSERYPDIVVTNHEPSGMDGIGLVRCLRATSGVPVVVIATEGSIAECEEAMRLGADRFLQLRLDLDRVGRVARELVGLARADTAHDRVPALTARQARNLRDRELSETLQRLLYETRGNIAEMARRIGKDRSTVRYHLKRFGMLEDRPIGVRAARVAIRAETGGLAESTRD
jgi:two-component system response regulator MtrA